MIKSIKNKFAKISSPGGLPPWFSPSLAVVAGVAALLALLLVQGTVSAGVSKPLDLVKYLDSAVTKELLQPAAPQDEPLAPASPSTSASPLASPSSLISSLISPFLSPSPPASSSASPSPSSTRGKVGACQQETDADDFAQALDFSDAKNLAKYLGLKGGKDELARVLRDCNDLEDLASSLGFSSPERLAKYLGLDDKRELAQSLGLDSSEKLAKRLGVDKGELSTLLNSATTDDGKATTEEGKSTTHDDRSGTDNGKPVTNRGTSTTAADATPTED